MASTNVANLQRALSTYARVTGYSAADPGAIDGVVGIKTASAVMAMVPLLPKVPSEIKAIAQLGPVALASPDVRTKVYAFITNNASTIRDAIIGLAAYQAATGGKIEVPTGPTSGGMLPGGGGGVVNPSTTIYFYDRRRNVYRVAVGVGLQSNLGASFVEVQSTTTRPNGMEVSRTTFLTQTGQWYLTWWGIGAMSVGAAALVGGTFALVRR